MGRPLPPPLDVVPPKPHALSAVDAARIAADAFGLTAEAEPHRDRGRTFVLTLSGEADGAGDAARAPAASARLLLEVAEPGTSPVELECQSAAADRVALKAPEVRVPLSRAGGTGATAMAVEHLGRQVHARVLDLLEGSAFSGSEYLSPATVQAIGHLTATVDLALEDFDLPGIERVHRWDLRHAPAVLDALLPAVGDPALRARVRTASETAWSAVERVAPELPEQTIHGGLTDEHLLWSDPLSKRPDGVVDFDDLTRSWTVGELAITLASLLHHDGVDLSAALRAVTAYDALRPLSSAEAAALWPLVVLRTAVLVASGHDAVAADPGDADAAGRLARALAEFDAAVSVPLPVASALAAAAIDIAEREIDGSPAADG